MTPRRAALLALLLLAGPSPAGPPTLSYLFPAGGQRGSTVSVRVGGLCLHDGLGWEVAGPGVTAGPDLPRLPGRWFEGPLLPLPDSQRTEDYPRDRLGQVRLAADARPGPRRVRVWTAEGVSAGPVFVVGELPEVVEDEADGDPLPQPVKLPVTVNGRIFPREDLDDWAVTLDKGQHLTAEAHAGQIGSPLDPRLELLGPDGRVLADADAGPTRDARLTFTAPAAGAYRVRVHDAQRQGSPAHVYRLTLTGGPHVTRVFPLGGRRGGNVALTLTGPGCPAGPVAFTVPTTGEPTTVIRPVVDGRPSGAVAFDLDDLPELTDTAAPALLPVPLVLNGRLREPGAAPAWRFAASKGDAVAVELRAKSLGSPLLGVLEVRDAADKVVAQAEAGPAGDPALTFRPGADGTYTVRLRDRFASRGGDAFAYRLRISRPVPGFAVSLGSDTLTLPRTGSVKLRVAAQRRGAFAAPVQLGVTGLPAGVTASPLTLTPGQAAGEITLTGSATAPVGLHRLQVTGQAVVDGKPGERVAASAPDGGPGELLLGVALAAPFKVVGAYDLRLAPRGSVFRKRFKVERNGYAGPLEVRLADRQARHLQGVTGPVVTVPAGATEFEYPVTLPPWMETGRTSRACVEAIGTVVVDGLSHTVSYTSQAQNDQLIAVVETGRLGLELARTSVQLAPGATAEVNVRVRRGKGLTGPVVVDLLQAPAGVSAAPVTIPADRDTGTLKLSLAGTAVSGARLLTLRATLTDKDSPVTAEAALEAAP